MKRIDWNELFEYDNGNLIWRDDAAGRKARKGEVAGHSGSKGYTSIWYSGRKYLAHRIIWEMHNGPITGGLEIDHINHNPGDNRIENLRLTNRGGNLKNKSKYSSNSSGVTGVHWRKDKRKWQAKIRVNKNFIHLGYFNDILDAELARKKAEEEYGFHDNHGV